MWEGRRTLESCRVEGCWAEGSEVEGRRFGVKGCILGIKVSGERLEARRIPRAGRKAAIAGQEGWSV